MRIRCNLAALTALKTITRECRPADQAELRTLARWSGWGAFPEVFDDTNPDYAWVREELAEMLTGEDLAAAARSTLNAHYTDAA